MDLAKIQVGKAQVSKVHFPALDTLRGVAIVVVLFHNLSIFAGTGGKLDKVWNLFVEAGWVGVQLFFVLSGFLITGILVDDRDKPKALRTFYVRRFLRIFPLYYLLLVVYFVWLPRPFGESIWYFLYLSNWSWLAYGVLPGLGAVWSLAVEEQFYLAWPWVARGVRTGTLAYVCVALIVIAFGARLGLHLAHYPDLWLYSTTMTRADGLAMGALVALAVRSRMWKARLDRALLPAAIVSVVGLLAVVALTHGMNRNNPIVQIAGYSLLGLGSAVLVSIAARPGTPPKWLDSRVLRFFGKYSYGIYVIHAPVKQAALMLWKREDAPLPLDLAFIATCTAVTIALALVTWNVLEKPLLGLKDRLAAR